MPTNNFHEITLCEVCGNDTLQSVLNLGHHPMCDDLVSIEDDRVCNEYP
ncbi:MAG: methyltransferase, partial [Hellea sp.]|nr:methyltransferase [Hellea sp.]